MEKQKGRFLFSTRTPSISTHLKKPGFFNRKDKTQRQIGMDKDLLKEKNIEFGGKRRNKSRKTKRKSKKARKTRRRRAKK